MPVDNSGLGFYPGSGASYALAAMERSWAVLFTELLDKFEARDLKGREARDVLEGPGQNSSHTREYLLGFLLP